jgi:hypothetical protein
MEFAVLVRTIANTLVELDARMPVHKTFRPGIGPFGEAQLVAEIAKSLAQQGLTTRTARHPDLLIDQEWAIEFKIARPFGDNGKQAENWSVNLLHPYSGSTSLLGDALTLRKFEQPFRKGLVAIGFEHDPSEINLSPLIESFEVLAREVMGVQLSSRVEEIRKGLVHPVHQVVRCVGWEVLE